MRKDLFTALVITCFASPVSGMSVDTSSQVCVVIEDGLEKSEASAYLAAIRIETQKSGSVRNWVELSERKACPDGQPLLILRSSTRASFMGVAAARRHFELSEGESAARARALARYVIQALDQEVGGGVSPLIGADVKPVAIREPIQSVERQSVSWGLSAGGIHYYQLGSGEHLGGAMLELDVGFLQNLINVGLVGSFASGSQFAINIDADERSDGVLANLQIWELVGWVGGGFELGAFSLRGLAGVGWHHGLLSAEQGEVRVPLNFTAVNSGVVVFEGRLLWQFTQAWHLGVTTGARLYLGDTTHVSADERIYASVDTALGSQIILGFTL